MKRYIKDGVIKYQKDITIEFIEVSVDEETGEKYESPYTAYNPSEEMILKDGWNVYDGCLEEDKVNKLTEIESYDKSEGINVFYLDEIPMWFDRGERIILKDRFERAIANSEETTIMRYNDIMLRLEPTKALEIINKVGRYADLCYDKTSEHKDVVNTLGSRKEVRNYDYTEGYPEVLHLTSK